MADQRVRSVILLLVNPATRSSGSVTSSSLAKNSDRGRCCTTRQTASSTVEHSVDLVALVGAGALYGLTANSAACALFGTDKPRRAQTEKARRKLDDLVGKSVLVRVDGVKGGAPSTWFLAENTITE